MFSIVVICIQGCYLTLSTICHFIVYTFLVFLTTCIKISTNLLYSSVQLITFYFFPLKMRWFQTGIIHKLIIWDIIGESD